MSNHTGLIAVPELPDSMGTAIHLTHQTYSHWLNIRLRRCGHVWQNRYQPLKHGRKPKSEVSAKDLPGN